MEFRRKTINAIHYKNIRNWPFSFFLSHFSFSFCIILLEYKGADEDADKEATDAATKIIKDILCSISDMQENKQFKKE